jgi:rod shape-determining protein MreD
MELRFVAANADVKVGDTLLTSGVDGIYPAGVPVATVTSVNRQGEGGFAHIGLAPVAKTGGLRFVLLVGPVDKQADTAVAAAVAAASAAASAASAASANEFGSARDEHHAAGRGPAAAAGQPLVHVGLAAAGAGLNLLPLGPTPWMPDFVALVLVFWSVHQPRRVGMAFFFGLLMDVHHGSLLGQHALAYSLLGFFGIAIHRRVLWFGLSGQMAQVAPAFFAATLLTLLVRAVAGGWPGWSCWSRRWPRPCCGRWPAWCCWRRSAARPIPTRTAPVSRVPA